MEADVGARPHELLNLRIKDVEFKEVYGSKYAKILVNGKRGRRSLVLIDSHCDIIFLHGFEELLI